MTTTFCKRPLADIGRAVITKQAANLGKFKKRRRSWVRIRKNSIYVITHFTILNHIIPTMKARPNYRLITRLLLLFMAGAVAGYSQPIATKTRLNVLKISPLVAFGHVSVFYERVISPRTSLLIGAGFGGQSYPYENNSTQVPEPGRYHYERLTLEARHYFGRQSLAPFGFFTGGYGRFARLSTRDYTFDQGTFVRDQAGNLVLLYKRMTVATIGGYVGLQTVVFRRFTFETFYGLQVQLPSDGSLSSASLPEAMSSAGLVGRIGLTIGYQF